MMTEKEIRDKLRSLINSIGNYRDEGQLRIIHAEIKRLRWVLGEGPDVILVPRPAR
jgi:aminoglycoside N3'-acetyltransferase